MPRNKAISYMHIFYLLIIYLFFFLIKAPEYATAACTDALMLCYTRVIPSLFPFLVLNELIISSNLAEHFGKIVGKPLSKIFKIKKEAAISLISGCLFGFPLGTKSTVSLYEKGYVSKKEAERLICFCSNTGPAFVLGVIGASLNNQKVALCIYVCQIISAVLIGLVLRRNDGFTEKKEVAHNGEQFSLSCVPKAVVSSVLPMLNICAFVCFFACISSSVENMIGYFSLNKYADIFVSGFLEITNGIGKLSYVELNSVSVWLSAFFVGWSGVSVILQSIDLTTKYGLDCKKFILSKLIQGFLCAALCVIICKLFNMY